MCLAGCSVKADRTRCPCLLDLTLSGGDEKIVQVCFPTLSSDAGARVAVDSTNRCRAEAPVRSEGLPVAFLSGIHSCRTEGDLLLIPRGCGMDEVFASSALLDTRCDRLSHSASLHRQFAFAYIQLDAVSGPDFPYEVCVRGNVCGMNIISMEPVGGEFLVSIVPFINQYHRICLPRQADDSLQLLFYEKGQTRADEGSELISVPLGSIIDGSGYDWTAADLEDIYVDVSYTGEGVSVNVLPWQRIII